LRADAAWHTQRDEWIRLGSEMAVLAGSLGKIATDLSLMAQGEIAELAEPPARPRRFVGDAAQAQPGVVHDRPGSRHRAPHQAAALLGAMAQQHERGLGNWQAELAEWPGLFLGVHGALRALNDAFAGLVIDRPACCAISMRCRDWYLPNPHRLRWRA
jgi:3-carboxy-cis,cis-muconate cycloisomerase